MLTQRKTTGSIRAGAKTGSLSLQWRLNPPMARTAGLNPPNQLFTKWGKISPFEKGCIDRTHSGQVFGDMVDTS
mgnify:CR=1 FL=1